MLTFVVKMLPKSMKHIYAATRGRAHSLLVALAADALLGELPNQVHPVVWMGRWLRLGERLAPSRSGARLLWGAAWLAGGAGIAGGAAALLPRDVILGGAAASTLLAYRALDRAVGEVQHALERDDLDQARQLLGWHLVSRPTAELRADEVAAAAIESLAENLSDSVVAPLLACLAGGLPALAIYRFCNTADALWGYRDQRYEQLGKAAARCDDLLNLAPARLTAALIALAAQVVGRRGWDAWRVALRDHGRTASPNAGWPMAAMAGGLATALAKRGHYTLGDGQRIPDAAMIVEARRVAGCVIGMLVAGLVGACLAAPGDGGR
jgi:adenosylcobinamide-phosphate synthase